MSTWKGWGWWRSTGSGGGDGNGDDDDEDGKKKDEKEQTPKPAEKEDKPAEPTPIEPESAAPKAPKSSEARKSRRRKRQDDENALSLDTEAPHVPRVIAIPVSPRPVFPTTAHPLRLTDKKLIETLVKLDRHGKPWLGIFLRKPGRVNDDGVREENQSDTMDSLDEVYDIGTLASIVQLRVDGDEAHLVVSGHRRIRATEMCAATSPLQVRVDHLKEDAAEAGSATVKAYTNELVSTMREVVTMNPMLREFINGFYTRFDVRDPYRLADFAASMATATTVEDGVLIHEVLAAMSLEERLEKALILMRKETALARVQQQISKQVDEKISQNQRKYFLMEQLKQIKKELGMETDDKEALATKFRKRLKGLDVPAEAQRTIDDEFEKLSSLEKNSSEFNVTRTYLDWLTSIPWGKHTDENFDIANARDVLEADHYGMADIKDRILEFIAVGNLKGSVHGKILCFVGPPGVGKTSIGKSIARSLGREYVRFSVGGLSDVSEIKGHRRTYVGAMPGKVIQGLKTAQSSNPLILIDEVDKLGRGMQGDPASALLELLDPSQNGAFVDHYLDTPVDVSKVLFICTANVLDTIPGPLRDRMEIIRLAGYDQPEKREIARQYLDRKAREQTGLDIGKERTPSSLELEDSALDALIRWYCREAGVRNLEKHIERIYRKTALKVVTATEQEVATGNWAITEDNLSDFVGKPVFTSDRLYDVTPPGVTMGLAWTAMGGTSLYIESSALTRRRREGSGGGGGGSMQVTGKLGEVMQESTRIAQTFARHVLEAASPDADFFDRAEVHVHVPEGATPKDGPSAGVTITTSLLSLATGVPVASDVAMTGELSLTGKVLPVGGIKEKVIAARRSGVKHVVLPKGNAKDVEELPEYLQNEIKITLAETYEDVVHVAFGGSSADVFAGKGKVGDRGVAAAVAADGKQSADAEAT